MRLTLVVPTLNELDGLKLIMPQIEHGWCEQIIILDGRSKDGSAQWARSQGYEVFVQQEKGMWNAYKELFESGMINGDIVITFSPDGNSLPKAIPVLKAMMVYGYDMVIASRYKDGAKSDDDTELTAFGNHLLTRIISFISKHKYTDSLVMYRAYRADIIKKLGLMDEPNLLQKGLMKLSNLYSWEPSLSIRAGKAGLKIAEIGASEPIAFRERRQNTFVHGFAILSQIMMENLR